MDNLQIALLLVVLYFLFVDKKKTEGMDEENKNGEEPGLWEQHKSWAVPVLAVFAGLAIGGGVGRYSKKCPTSEYEA